MKKERQYILLPTDKASNIYKYSNEDNMYFDSAPNTLTTLQNYFLYILSDDEINHGDYFYSKAYDSIRQSAVDKHDGDGCNKIIATTNPALHIKLRPKTKDDWHNDDFINDVANISQSDLEHIISLYNGEEIDIDKLAREKCNFLIEGGSLKENCIVAMKEMYIQYLSDNADKKFTKSDLFIFVGFYSEKKKMGKDGETIFKEFEEAMQAHCQPKRDTVMVVYKKGIDNEIYTPLIQDGCIIILRD